MKPYHHTNIQRYWFDTTEAMRNFISGQTTSGSVVSIPYQPSVTNKSIDKTCSYCGRKFIPDKRGNCSNCGADQ